MAGDALDPGDDGSYPYFPRRPDGAPYWSDDPLTDGIPLAGPDGIPRAPMPRGLRTQRSDGGIGVEKGAAWDPGDRVVIDVTPRHTDGSPIVVPLLP